MERRGIVVTLALTALLLQACAERPEPESVRADLQRALDGMEDGLLRIVALNPQGTAPAPDDGGRVVYANVALELARDHDFGTWEGATVGTLASTLGATDKGVRGVKDGGNAAGDRLEVYASAVYAPRDGGWQFRGGGAPGQRAAASPLRAGEGSPLTTQLEAILARMQGNDDVSRARLVERAVTRALADIQRQLAEAESGGVIVAGGPAGGEYSTIARGLTSPFARRGTPLSVFHSDGSIENARLVNAGDVALGIMQSDVLALAHAGEGPFSTGAPLGELVALAALYPEPVHVVVPADSEIRTLSGLAGRRVSLGPTDSGTRYTAGRILEAHGLAASALGRVDDSDLETAAARLAGGEIDAMFATIGAPAGALRRLASRRAVRLLPLDVAALDALVAGARSYVRYVVPRSTYRGQRAPVPTVATTAVLVARRDADDALVASALDALFFGLDFEAAGSLQGKLIAPHTARRGLPVPLHPAAERFYAALPPRR